MNRPGSRLTSARCQGFSLLEILVAFMIMALTLGVLFQVFSSGLRTAMVAEEYGEATRIAESLLAEFSGLRPLEPGEQGGWVDDTHYRWQASIVPVSTEGLAPTASERFEAIEIAVRVAWRAGTGDREVELRTVRLAVRP
jgi:general secretion pathway protein I